MHTPLFQGLSAFPLTPASADGRVDTDALGALVDRLVVAGVDSIGLLGSTGIYAYLEHSERQRALAAAVEAIAGRTPLIAGVGALRTDWTLHLAQDAEAQGADALLIAPVSYTPLSEAEITAHYTSLAGATGLPICLYNNPTTTHFTFSETLLARLSKLPGVAAVKMPLPKDSDITGELDRLRTACEPGFRVGYSGDRGIAPALLAGADGFYSGVAGILPAPTLALARAAMEGRADEAAGLDLAFQPLWALCNRYGALRVCYAIGRLLNLAVGEPPLPLRPLPLTVIAEVEAAIAPLVAKRSTT